MDVVPALVDSLKNDDIPTCFNSEIALWNIWSRSGDESVDKMLNAGRISLKDKDIFEAVEQFTSVIEAAPDFAEGYNQRAIAYFMLEDWENSLKDCKRVIKLNPYHFGAFAGTGTCLSQIG